MDSNLNQTHLNVLDAKTSLAVPSILKPPTYDYNPVVFPGSWPYPTTGTVGYYTGRSANDDNLNDDDWPLGYLLYERKDIDDDSINIRFSLVGTKKENITVTWIDDLKSLKVSVFVDENNNDVKKVKFSEEDMKKVDVSKIKVDYTDGLLEVVFPYKDDYEKKLEIK
jgi:HSP20 family molecular chaperone IbpA